MIICGVKFCNKDKTCNAACQCVDCVAIPITHQERAMTTQEKIDYLKADLLKAKGAEQVSASDEAGRI